VIRQFKYSDDVSLPYALQFFKSLGEGFRVETTGSSITLVNHRFCWLIASERFMPWHLGLLSLVKAEVRRNAHKVAELRESESPSFDVNITQFPGPTGSYMIDELDLTSAYLQAAAVLGLLSPETIARLKRLPKRWRLRILGAIASKRKVDHYNGSGKVIGSEIVTDDELRHCWFCIVAHIDRFNGLLRDAVGTDFVFSWYDNFFCRVGALSPRILAAIGLKFRLSRCTLSWNRVNTMLLATIDNKRRFFLPAPDLTRTGGGR
jgi:hypothetical protein